MSKGWFLSLSARNGCHGHNIKKSQSQLITKTFVYFSKLLYIKNKAGHDTNL